MNIYSCVNDICESGRIVPLYNSLKVLSDLRCEWTRVLNGLDKTVEPSSFEVTDVNEPVIRMHLFDKLFSFKNT